MSRSFLSFIVVLLLGTNAYTWYARGTERSEFEARESELLETRTRLETRVRELEVLEDTLRAEIETLNRRLADARLVAGEFRRQPGLEQRLKRSYPELARTDWGVVEVYDEGERGYVDYMVVPLWMSESFILDHTNARATGRCLRGQTR